MCLAQKLGAGVRAVDVVSRVGGEEFALLLPYTDANSALEVAEKIRVNMAQTPIPTRLSELPVTTSFGVTSLPQGKSGTVEGMYVAADQALYAAKNNGSNRVEFYTPR